MLRLKGIAEPVTEIVTLSGYSISIAFGPHWGGLQYWSTCNDSRSLLEIGLYARTGKIYEIDVVLANQTLMLEPSETPSFNGGQDLNRGVPRLARDETEDYYVRKNFPFYIGLHHRQFSIIIGERDVKANLTVSTGRIQFGFIGNCLLQHIVIASLSDDEINAIQEQLSLWETLKPL